MGAAMLPGTSLWLEGCAPSANPFSRIDWPALLGACALRWKQYPKDMTEAPHFGNGLIGSMIWMGSQHLRIQVFRSDVHDHADHTYGWTAYSRPRYQIGYFTLSLKGDIESCDLIQDLYNAELTGCVITSAGKITISHFVHRHDDLIYTRLTCEGEEALSDLVWHPFPARSSRAGDPGSKSYGRAYAPYRKLENPEPVMTQTGQIQTCTQNLSAGGNYATAWYQQKTQKEWTLLTTVQNSYPEQLSEELASQAISRGIRAVQGRFRQWKEDHQKWWHAYYPESFIQIADFDGIKFYWGNVYRMACCTRPDAKYIDTPGMWNSGGPWPYSTHDFNTQTAHFPVYTANRLHLGEALLQALRENKENLTDNVTPAEWKHDSALLPLATAFDLKGKRNGDARYEHMVGCLPWLLNNIWLHYRYTMDTGILKDPLYPLLRRSINLYRHLMVEEGDGSIHLPKTFSPELGNFSDANFDLALLRWGCQRLIEICTILNVDDPLQPEWERIGERLVDYPVDDRGYKLGNERSAPTNHQHMSHLLMIYPLYLENRYNRPNTDLLLTSLRNFHPTGGLRKMAASQSSPAAAALGEGNLACQWMETIRTSQSDKEKLGINGIYYLATPCIETSLAYNTCVQDMLLQSWGNRISVFPAVPDDWQDVEFQNLRTEGAFLVCAKRVKGKTVAVKLKSLAGEPCLIDLSMGEEPLQIQLKKGEEKLWTKPTR